MQRRFQDPVLSVRFSGAAEATPAPGVLEAIRSAEIVMLAPSNPVTSIAPILAIPGIRQALNDTHSPVAAVSPIIGRAAVTGPAGALLAAQGFAVSIAGVADFYRDFLDLLVVDSQDAEAARDLNGDVVGIHVTPTIMRTGGRPNRSGQQRRRGRPGTPLPPGRSGAGMILVPVKNLTGAKQRLSSVLSPPERFALAQAMCQDVLQTLADWPGCPPVAIVTSDSFARDLAARFHFEVIVDDNSGETAAIEMATTSCRQRGAKSSLVIPADIPLIDASELHQIVSCAPHTSGTVLVPDAAGHGTNAVWRSPADLFPLRFGNDSFLPHQAAANAAGFPCIVVTLPGIARDVDRPEDLLELAAAAGNRHSQKLVRSWHLTRRNVFPPAEQEWKQNEDGLQPR